MDPADISGVSKKPAKKNNVVFAGFKRVYLPGKGRTGRRDLKDERPAILSITRLLKIIL
jgi:hypothetical protein